MSAEFFQFLFDEKFDNSIKKSDFVKTYHQNGQKVNDENQDNKFYSGENLNYIQVGDGFFRN